MRLQLRRVAAVVAVALGCAGVDEGRAGADDFVVKTQIYTDSDHTTVVSPLVHISKDAWRGGTLGAGFVADVVTSASVDVVTNATRRMTEFRKEASAGLAQKLANTTLEAGYIFSSENDYTSHNVTAGITQDVLQRTTTLGLKYTLSLNDVGRSGDANFHRGLDVHSVDATWAQVVTRRFLLYAGYTFIYASGYQASPYRFVHVESAPDFKVPETDPDRRIRNAFVAGFKVHLGTNSALQADYRFYFDDWGIKSHTGELAYYVDWKYVTLRVRERFYFQGAASFFQSHYAELTPFITADRELSTLWSNRAGIKLTYKLDKWVRGFNLETKVDVFYFNYIDFAYLSNRTGADLGAGASYQF